ncbi:ATP-dependent DNA helicase [Frankliniella fusca]|uniref:ATP-dependent DNA helicase n=1 Tax=Frankliniella fusca TaxID=407009 RepID=A0AAE1L854_9NEOP|nr:ATP-dependent DNA helicase [Frankliniella fusca]
MTFIPSRSTQSITLPEFEVRKDKVLKALIWLKENNPNYSDITIDYQNLDSLPDNGNNNKNVNDLSHNLHDDDDDDDDVDNVDDIIFSHVPDSPNTSANKSFKNFLIWPSLGTTPINEFSSPSYISLCFPHLFAYGKADYTMPRPHKVKLSEYIQHLMLYKDGRFSKDERFRYFMMNSEMSWNSLNLGNVCVRKNSIFSKMTILQMKDYFKRNPWITNQIMHFGSRIRTTKSYWNSRCSELLDMVNQIGTPAIFFTLISADYHWPDLYRLMGYNVRDLSIPEKSKLLSQNPMIADTFFYLRSKYFLEKSFKNHFDVVDIWYRYEFQHRGSIHLHGLALFRNAPVLKGNMSREEKESFLHYFDNIITCENEDMNLLPSHVHPCQVNLDDVEDVQIDICQLVNHLQRHTKCRKSHCLRPVGRSKQLECRYKFPMDMRERSELDEEDGNVIGIKFKRNDQLLNKYNKWVLQTWRANIDISPIVNKRIVYRYIAKYASTSEIKSLCYNQVLTDILNTDGDGGEMSKKAIRKLLVSSCAERDDCAQEVIHFLMGYHCYHSSREFVIGNLKSVDWLTVSNFSVAKFFKFNSGNFIVRSKRAVVRYFPRLAKDHDEDLYYTYMCQLFYPWRNVDDVAEVDEQMKLYIDFLYKKYIEKGTDDYEQHSSDDEDDNEAEKSYSQNFDKESILLALHPKCSSRIGDVINKRNIGVRWDYLANKLNRETVQTIVEQLKNISSPKVVSITDVNDFNCDQKRVFKFIRELVYDIKNNSETSGCFAIVQGMPGTGKTYLLKSCVDYVRKTLGDSSVKVIAPTGVSAKIINGTTLHSFLSLGRNSYRSGRLTGLELMNFQDKHKNTKIIFLDEYSMVGLRMLACIEKRCRDLTECEKLFGNLTVILFGDINQLLPVCDQPLYANIENLSQYNELLERGKVIMTELSRSFILSGNHGYVKFLKRVSKGSCTIQDMSYIKDRYLHCMSSSERQKFEDSLRLCSTNDSANEYNLKKILNMNQPIAVIKADNNNKTAFLTSDDMADGLLNVIMLCRGARVMLRRNINVCRGLVNGAIGIVKHIVYEHVEFDSIDLHDIDIKYIPITPIQSTWYKQNVSCTRSQLPLALCWACTIHKS